MLDAKPSARLTSAALALTIAGIACAASPVRAATFGAARTARPVFPQTVQPDARKPLLYVADNANNQISVFDVTKTQSPPPIQVIKRGLSGPQGITTDLSGNLYVANINANTVTVYAPSHLSPKLTYSIGLNLPVDVRVDSSGNVYVANSPGLGQQSFIVEYLAGQTTPAYTWSTPQGNMLISGMALLNPAQPGQTSIYAAFYTVNGSGFASGNILTCYPGNSTCTVLGYAFGQTGGIAVEQSPVSSAPLDFLVIDQYIPGVDNFQLGHGMTQLIIPGTPEFLALNSKRTHLFVSDRFHVQVTEYSYPGGSVRNQFYPARGQKTAQVYGVATSPAGTYF